MFPAPARSVVGPSVVDLGPRAVVWTVRSGHFLPYPCSRSAGRGGRRPVSTVVAAARHPPTSAPTPPQPRPTGSGHARPGNASTKEPFGHNISAGLQYRRRVRPPGRCAGTRLGSLIPSPCIFRPPYLPDRYPLWGSGGGLFSWRGRLQHWIPRANPPTCPAVPPAHRPVTFLSSDSKLAGA